jgi:hypothetical protein
MTSIIQFSSKAGAASNYIAKQCMWAGVVDDRIEPEPDKVNEYFIPRTKIGNHFENRHELWKMKCDDEELLQKTSAIKPKLMELHYWCKDNKPETFLNSANAKEVAQRMEYNRGQVIGKLDIMWKDEWCMAYSAFWDWEDWGRLSGKSVVLSEYVLDLIEDVQQYFVDCKLYYWKVCEQKGWNILSISHQHTYVETPGLILPDNFVHGYLRCDTASSKYIDTLLEIKRGVTVTSEYLNKILSSDIDKDHDPTWGVSKWTEELSHEIFDYRKIFIDNDSNEIQRLYDFFLNLEYFEEHKERILQEFFDYNDKNMKLMKSLALPMYEEVNK